MSRGKNSDSGRPKARSVARYTIYNVTEPAELMDFLMRKMAGISRSKVKALLANRVILVDNVITTQFNFALKRCERFTYSFKICCAVRSF